MPQEQEENQAWAFVRDTVLYELALIVEQPTNVISLDDRLVETIHADVNDLAFDFIPCIQESLAVRIPPAEWAEARTVRQVCDLVASYYRRKTAPERQALERRLERIRLEEIRKSPVQIIRWPPRYWSVSPYWRWRRSRRLWRHWRRDARTLERALLSGPMFNLEPQSTSQVALDEDDPTFVLVRDVVFWVLEGITEQPRSIMTLDDRFGEPPYVEAHYDIDLLFVRTVEDVLAVDVSYREWSNAGTIRDICQTLARHYQAKPAHERAGIEAALRAWRIDEYNAQPPRQWWQVWRWRLPRWPV